MPPCVAERRGAKRGGSTGRSAAKAKPVGVVNVPHRVVGQGGAEPARTRRRPWKTPMVLEIAAAPALAARLPANRTCAARAAEASMAYAPFQQCALMPQCIGTRETTKGSSAVALRTVCRSSGRQGLTRTLCRERCGPAGRPKSEVTAVLYAPFLPWALRRLYTFYAPVTHRRARHGWTPARRSARKSCDNSSPHFAELGARGADPSPG